MVFESSCPLPQSAFLKRPNHDWSTLRSLCLTCLRLTSNAARQPLTVVFVLLSRSIVPEASVIQMSALPPDRSWMRGSSNVAVNFSSYDHLYKTSVVLFRAVVHSVLRMTLTVCSVTVMICSNPERTSSRTTTWPEPVPPGVLGAPGVAGAPGPGPWW
jgi:hypothetical protein